MRREKMENRLLEELVKVLPELEWRSDGITVSTTLGDSTIICEDGEICGAEVELPRGIVYIDELRPEELAINLKEALEDSKELSSLLASLRDSTSRVLAEELPSLSWSKGEGDSWIGRGLYHTLVIRNGHLGYTAELIPEGEGYYTQAGMYRAGWLPTLRSNTLEGIIEDIKGVARNYIAGGIFYKELIGWDS